jgi:GSCFA family
MDFKINFDFPKQANAIKHHEKIMLIGSCFTENICKKMEEVGYQTFQNPNGIIFNPISVASSIRNVVKDIIYDENSLFYAHEAWHSWLHHSKFSNPNKALAIQNINNYNHEAHQFLKTCDWLIITLGSAFAYRHQEMDMHVSNNHRAPAATFTRELLDINFIIENLKKEIALAKSLNPSLKIIFTVSPVRHLREGVIDNNRSKARLIESVHQLVGEIGNCFYFPSYEIVIDELRDYRFFDIDNAHPNFLATEYVWQRFIEKCIADDDKVLIQELKQIAIAKNHKAFNAASQAHQLFLKTHFQKCEALEIQYPHLNLSNEKKYFSN